MNRRLRRNGNLPHIALAVLLFLSGAIFATGSGRQEDESGTRRIWDSSYIDKKGAVHARGRRRYRLVTPRVPTIGVAGDSVVGVTIWRLQQWKPDDSGARLLVHTDAGANELRPIRTESDTRFSIGERVRLGIEAARDGFLYVVDREQYADGKLGEPYVIFPTLKTRMGQNEVLPGRLVEIPGRDDNPPYFTLTPSRTGEVAEVLTIIISPSPLQGITIGSDVIKLDEAKVSGWEKAWGTAPGKLELEDGTGRGWTAEEKDAGEAGTRLLRQEDPGPQTLYYNPRAKPGMPVLVKLDLRYGKEK